MSIKFKKLIKYGIVLGLIILALAINIRAFDNLEGKVFVQYSDTKGYSDYAINLAAGRGYFLGPGVAPASRVPVYPLFLAVIFTIFGHSITAVQVFELCVFLGTCVITYLIAKKLFSNQVGILAGFLVAINPDLRTFVYCLMSENIFNFMLMLSLLMYIIANRKGFTNSYYLLGTGIAFAVVSLTREAFFYYPLFLGFIMLVIYLYKKYSENDSKSGSVIEQKQALLKIAVILFIYGITIMPWLVRNSLIYGKVTGLSNNAGAYPVFYLGVSESFSEGWMPQRYSKNWLTESQQNELDSMQSVELRNKKANIYALKFRLRNPLASWYIYKGLWSMRMSTDLNNFLNGYPRLNIKMDYFLLPLGLLGFFVSLFYGIKNQQSILSVFIYFNLLHFIFIGIPRYRIPLVPILSIYCSFLLFFIYSKICMLFTRQDKKDLLLNDKLERE